MPTPTKTDAEEANDILASFPIDHETLTAIARRVRRLVTRPRDNTLTAKELRQIMMFDRALCSLAYASHMIAKDADPEDDIPF